MSFVVDILGFILFGFYERHFFRLQWDNFKERALHITVNQAPFIVYYLRI